MFVLCYKTCQHADKWYEWFSISLKNLARILGYSRFANRNTQWQRAKLHKFVLHKNQTSFFPAQKGIWHEKNLYLEEKSEKKTAQNMNILAKNICKTLIINPAPKTTVSIPNMLYFILQRYTSFLNKKCYLCSLFLN